jgi:hypothetical protein
MMDKTSTINPFWSKGAQNSSSTEKSYYTSASVTARGDNGQRDALSSRQHVAILRNKLGFFDKIGVDRQSRAEAKRTIGELVVNILEKQKQEILFKITLELAGEKKRAFAESMRAGSQIEKEIAELSTDFERDLIELALNHGLAGHERKKAWLEYLEKRYLDGKIDDESLMIERRAVENWVHVFRDNLDAKVEIILRNHAQQIEKALAIFRERAISGHGY